MSGPTHRPSPYQISAFAHTVREGSVSAAARKLGVTQSAVSQHLQKLEHNTGARLILQSRDGLSLTKTGRELFELADRYLSAEQMIGEKLSDYAQLRRGHLSIIANAPQPALQLIAAYSSQFPDVEIEFSLFDWSSAMRMLNSRTVDIAIVAAPAKSADFVCIEIDALRYVLYMRRDHRLARRKRISLGELQDERLILPEAGSLTQRLVSQALDRHKIGIRRIIKMTTFPLMKDAILQGVGVGPFLEKSGATEDGLATVAIKEMPEKHPISLVVHRDKADLHLIRSFMSAA